MSSWSKPSHQFATAAKARLPDGFKPGIDLSLGELIETRNKPIIQWLAPESQVKTNRVGGFRSRFKGRGMDFDEVRLYQIGDDIRNIDWRVTARTGEAHTKLFKEEREKPVFVVLDQMPSMFFGTAQVFKSLIASQIASQLMWNTLSNGDRFGALLFSENRHFEMKPSSNRRNCMRLLNRIVENYSATLKEVFGVNTVQDNQTEQNSSNQFADTLKRLKFLAKPGTLIHLVSDFNHFDDNCARHLSKLSQHADIHCILVNDPIEKDLPPAGLYGITDGLKNGLLNTDNHELRNDYRESFSKKIEMIKEFSLSHKGVFTIIDTNYQQESVGHHSTTGNSINSGSSSSSKLGEQK